MIFKYFICVILFLSISCLKEKVTRSSTNSKTILIQPFKDLKEKDVKEIVKAIKLIYPKLKVLNPIDFPKNSYYSPRNRYRADSIIKYLNNRTETGFVTLGLTSKDISVTKGDNPDFGIMGLGYKPGKSCIASNFRLNKKNIDQFYKIAIHELGHSEGLNHCADKTCFMRDAEGGNPTDKETDFCAKCKKFLISKNWNFK